MSRSTKYPRQHIVKLKDINEWISYRMCYFVVTLLSISIIIVLSACSRGFVGGNNDSTTKPSYQVQIPNSTTQPQEIKRQKPHNVTDPLDNQKAKPGTPLESALPSDFETMPSEKLEFIKTPDSDVAPTAPSKPNDTPNPSVTPKPSATPKQSGTSRPGAILQPTLDIAVGVVNPYVSYTYDQMIQESLKLYEEYQDIITLDTIGSSVEGRDLLLIKLGKGEKKIVLCGTHHAREYISSSYLMKMIEEYAKAYASNSKFGDYDIKNLLSQATLYIVPMVNPDGVNLVNNGLNSVADKEAVQAMSLVRPTYREWKANINGVDLNRQYPACWEEKYDNVGIPASENYKGTAAATEPEIKAMMKLSEENDFILAASFHTKGNSFFWADEGTVDKISGVEAMAKRLAALTKYKKLPVSKKPSIYGAGYENWFRMEFERPAFCIELTPHNNTDVPHDDKKFDSLVWNNAKYIGLFLADEALKR